MNRATLAAIAALGLGAGATAWWQFQGADPAAPPAAPDTGPRRAAYTMGQVTVTQMTPRGDPPDRLSARALAHYAPTRETGPGHSELDQPRLTVHRPQGPPWQLAARSGWVSARGDEVRLLGRVVIERPGSPHNRGVQAVTRDLRVYPPRDLAQTDAPATLRSQGLHTEGVGLRAELAADRLTLLSEVRSIHGVR